MIRLVRASWRGAPGLDTAVSRALLQRVGEGAEPETLRLFQPQAQVAFGPQDRLSPGYAEAVRAAGEAGFGAIERLAGGRAAVYHEGTLAFAWSRPEPLPRDGIRARFEELADIMCSAMRGLGVDARVGQVAGEYCPGDHSVNARGATKLMGVGQRVTARAAHVGGVVVVSGAGRVRDVLVPVYAALGLDWDERTVGSVEEEVPGLTWEGVEAAIADEFATRHGLEEGQPAPETIDLARRLAPLHVPKPAGSNPAAR